MGRPPRLLGLRCLLQSRCRWCCMLLRALPAAARAPSCHGRRHGRARCDPALDRGSASSACDLGAACSCCWLADDLAGPWVVLWKPGGLAPADQGPQYPPVQILTIAILVHHQPAGGRRRHAVWHVWTDTSATDVAHGIAWGHRGESGVMGWCAVGLGAHAGLPRAEKRAGPSPTKPYPQF